MNITVVLVRPQHPANLGFIARSMKNFGCKNLILIDPLCNKNELEAIKTSKHALEILDNAKIIKNGLSELKDQFETVVGTTSILGTDYNVSRTPLSPYDFAHKIHDENIALVFGNEGTGLLNEEIDHCDFIISIPSSKEYPALNLSHAVSIVLYELYQAQGSEKIDKHFRHATITDKKVLIDVFHDILNQISFTTPEKKETQKIVWKRVFEKAMLSKRESFALIGFLKK